MPNRKSGEEKTLGWTDDIIFLSTGLVYDQGGVHEYVYRMEMSGCKLYVIRVRGCRGIWAIYGRYMGCLWVYHEAKLKVISD